MKESRGPLAIAIILLLLPFVYVGSYLALVQPNGMATGLDDPMLLRTTNYRWDVRFTPQIFWPLEEIDRKLRPDRWRFVYPRKRSSGFAPERPVIESSLP